MSTDEAAFRLVPQYVHYAVSARSGTSINPIARCLFPVDVNPQFTIGILGRRLWKTRPVDVFRIIAIVSPFHVIP